MMLFFNWKMDSVKTTEPRAEMLRLSSINTGLWKTFRLAVYPACSAPWKGRSCVQLAKVTTDGQVSAGQPAWLVVNFEEREETRVPC